MLTKIEAITLLGGSQRKAAREIGITQQAVNRWPPTLTARLRDRVQAALYRREREQPSLFPSTSSDAV
jgi:hypothetical protein